MRVLTQLRQPNQFRDETGLPGSPRFGMNSLVVGAASRTLILHLCPRVFRIEEMLHSLLQSFAHRKMSAPAAPEFCPSNVCTCTHSTRQNLFLLKNYLHRYIGQDGCCNIHVQCSAVVLRGGNSSGKQNPASYVGRAANPFQGYSKPPTRALGEDSQGLSRYKNEGASGSRLGRGSCGDFRSPFLRRTRTNRKGLVLFKILYLRARWALFPCVSKLESIPAHLCLTFTTTTKSKAQHVDNFESR